MGTGTAVATNDVITAAKMNLKLESVAASEVDSGVAFSLVFHVDCFHFPAPGTDWTPHLYGAYLASSKTTKYCWLPRCHRKSQLSEVWEVSVVTNDGRV